jgi:nicotinate-nucleotide adenylyltransferase
LKLGVMGGTFDPIHIAHLIIAEEALFRYGLDKVVFVPSARPPHKTRAPHTPAADRLEMVRLAIEDNPRLEASDMELNREGPSYTIDTLRELRQVHGEGTGLFFIAGADSILELMTWKEPGQLLDEAKFIVANRPGFPVEKLEYSLPEQTSRGARSIESVYMMDMPALDISASDIRERASGGRAFRYMLPDKVWRYVCDKGLYGKGQAD